MLYLNIIFLKKSGGPHSSLHFQRHKFVGTCLKLESGFKKVLGIRDLMIGEGANFPNQEERKKNLKSLLSQGHDYLFI